MFLFNGEKVSNWAVLNGFKYILCFYSIGLVLSDLGEETAFKYILCFYSIKKYANIIRPHDTFKYILCFYSIFYQYKKILNKSNLNTSYVSIQFARSNDWDYFLTYLNTSYVSIQ